MNTESPADLQNEIIQTIRDMNRAWMEADFARLEEYFHKNIIIVTPDLQRAGIGIDACLASYKGFISSGKVHNFEDRDIGVDIVDNTAVVTYEYDIDYEMSGKRSMEAGREVLVFSRDTCPWKLLWRMIVSITQK